MSAHGRFRLEIRKISLAKGLSSRGTAAQDSGRAPALEGFKSCVVGALEDMVRGGLGSAGLMGRLDGLRGLFQPK